MQFRLLSLLGLFAVSTPTSRAADPKGVEFFEQKIRPVLVEQCQKCHSAEAEKSNKLKGQLLLDSKAGLAAGGESGALLDAKEPKNSLLLKSLRYDGDLKMPPKGKLPDAVIADFEKWVAMGAPDPRDGTGAVKKQVGLTLEEGRKFWSYIPPKSVEAPTAKNKDWNANPIDRFIAAGLEAKGLSPAKPADRATLARRLYYDLAGYVPTPAELDAFVKDDSPNAVETLVDKLLASPAFGERWGRNWLDVARYAESVTLRGFILDEAWRYRDYVIESFNADVPFDRFIREQIAGDLMTATDPAERRRQIVATTFLALGNTNLEEQDKKMLRMDVVDEQLDVITKGFLAQTVTCARCHDHKFDPIPTKDYYSLAGILRNAKTLEHANVSKWIDVPLPVDPAMEAKFAEAEKKIASLQARIKAEKSKGAAKAGGILLAKDIPGVVVDDAAAKKVGDWMHSQHSGSYIGDGYVHDKNEGKGEKTLTFQPENLPPGKYEVRLAYSAGTSRSNKVPVSVFSADGEKELTIDMQKGPPIDGRYVSLGEFRFEKGGFSHVIISNEDTKGHVTADAVVYVPETTDATTSAKKVEPKTDSTKTLEAELKKLQETSPKRPKVISVVEEKQIEDAKVHIRGNPHNLGESAPRGVLQVASVGSVSFPKDKSGRLELANWIASKENPLTARVIVNRTWHWLFGSGIVRTTDNFGTTGEKPSNPELLDALSLQFIADGWSMKKLVRSIVLSQAYQQSSVGDPKALAADPENRLFGRANRRRMTGESIRDSILRIAGTLSEERGGSTFPATLSADYSFKANSTRRSVYLPMFRNALPELLEVFDAADPSTVTGVRNVSTVAPQALYLMNNPFVAEQAKLAAAKLMASNDSEEIRIGSLYRATLGREPTDGERTVATNFLRNRSDAKDAWTKLVHAVFASADFRFVN
jgi:cytochrome c553